MSPISVVHISSVRSNVSKGFIAQVFNRCDIAKVGRITFKSIYRDGKAVSEFKRVIMEIKAWHDTEAAYSFIKRLPFEKGGAKIYPSRNQYWIVKEFKIAVKIPDNNISIEELTPEEFGCPMKCEECGDEFIWGKMIQSKECGHYYCQFCVDEYKICDGWYCDDCPRRQKKFCTFIKKEEQPWWANVNIGNAIKSWKYM